MQLLPDSHLGQIQGGVLGSIGSQLGTTFGVLGVPLFSFHGAINFGSRLQTEENYLNPLLGNTETYSLSR